jgi:hypothetical protein
MAVYMVTIVLNKAEVHDEYKARRKGSTARESTVSGDGFLP